MCACGWGGWGGQNFFYCFFLTAFIFKIKRSWRPVEWNCIVRRRQTCAGKASSLEFYAGALQRNVIQNRDEKKIFLPCCLFTVSSILFRHRYDTFEQRFRILLLEGKKRKSKYPMFLYGFLPIPERNTMPYLKHRGTCNTKQSWRKLHARWRPLRVFLSWTTTTLRATLPRARSLVPAGVWESTRRLHFT